MKPALALLALAVVVLAAWSRAGNTRSVKGARLTAGDHGAPDDSEVVGMPTTWSAEQDNATTIGPRRVVHGLPTF